MRRPTTRLLITFLVSLVIGYALAWLIMLLLGVELRAFGISTLSIVAILIAMVLVIILDGPLDLKTFEWPQPDEEEADRDDNVRHLLLVSILVVVIGGGVALWLNNARLLPIQASAESISLDNLLRLHFWVIGFLFALVSVFMVYSIVVFRRKAGDTEDGAYMHGHTTLEILWTVVPLAIVLYFGYLGANSLAEITTPKPEAMVVEVDAFQWGWNFSYPEFGGKKSPELNLPRDRQILLKMNSRDVIHSFWVPEFRVKQDVVPGRTTQLLVTPIREGQYKVRCAEMCGLAHSTMRATVNVMPAEEFQAWATGGGGAAQGNLTPAERGAQLVQQCLGCHSTNGSQLVGPTWKGLFGTQVTLADGSTVTADEAYIRNSIINPNAQVVQGFPPSVMPGSYGSILSDEDINDIIAYIKSLAN
jgi:cytochrome c oxidase subunit 2